MRIQIENAIEKDKWDLVLVTWQLESILQLIPDDKRAQQSREYVETINPERVIVIPQQTRVLLIRIMATRRSARHKPVFRISITFRWHSPTVQVNYRSDVRLSRFRSVDAVVDRQKMFAR